MPTGSKEVLFNDGEILVEGDINQAQKWSRALAWEVPGYANVISFDRVGLSYSDAFADTTSAAFAREYGVFTQGGGLKVNVAQSGLVSSLGAGFLGVWHDEAGYLTGPPVPTAQHMRWVWIGSSDWSYTHLPAASGSFRWDLVTCKIGEASGDETTRSFETASGTKTTQKFNKSSTMTLDLSAETSVISLPESASPARPTRANIPSGRKLLYAVKVGDSTYSALQGLIDYTIPFGPMIRATQTGIAALNSGWKTLTAGNWETQVGTVIQSSAAAQLNVLPPGDLVGDPSVRILAADVTFKFSSQVADTAKLVKGAINAAAATIADLSGASGFVCDGSVHTVRFDLRGCPTDDTVGPIWGGGLTTKSQSDEPTFLMLQFDVGGAGREVHSVTWYAIRG